MNTRELIKGLQDIFDEAKLASDWRHELAHVRRTSESDTETLIRVLRERAGIVALLQELKEPHEAFDHKYAYGESLAARLRRHLGLD